MLYLHKRLKLCVYLFHLLSHLEIYRLKMFPYLFVWFLTMTIRRNIFDLLSVNTFILFTQRNLPIKEAKEAEISPLQAGFFSYRYLKFMSQGLNFPLVTVFPYVQFSIRQVSLCYWGFNISAQNFRASWLLVFFCHQNIRNANFIARFSLHNPIPYPSRISIYANYAVPI